MTIAIETVIMLVILKITDNNKYRFIPTKKIILTGIIASGTTLPFVWYIFPIFIHNRTYFIIVAELFAFIVEIAIIKKLLNISWYKAIIVSLLVNGSSFLSGYFLRITM